MAYFDGTKILSLMDINGKKPEIYMVTDVRTTGKTTFFVRMITKKALSGKGKFVYLVRYENELDGLAEALYKEIGDTFFKGVTFDSKIRGKGMYCDILANGDKIGYGLPLNSYDKIKKKSHLFMDAICIYMDEFQSETNRYVKDEIKAFASIHSSLARGAGKRVRYLPVYMSSNHITLLNPYFNLFGLTNLHKKTKYYRGDGFVLFQDFNEDAIKEMSGSAFNRALKNTDYSCSQTQGRYLLDDNNYIRTFRSVKNKSYMLTLIYKGEEFGVYSSNDTLYCSHHSDHNYPVRYVIGMNIGENSRFLQNSPFTVREMRKNVANGTFLFESQLAKECIFKALSY